MWDGWKQLLKIDKYSLKRVVKDTHRFLGGGNLPNIPSMALLLFFRRIKKRHQYRHKKYQSDD